MTLPIRTKQKSLILICESLRYEGEDLFWGIPCPKCSVCYVSGQEQYDLYENKDNLTFASIFVNGNHEETQRRLPQVLRGKEVIFVGHHSADVSRLPFPITKHFGVGTNAWLNVFRDFRGFERVYEGFGRINCGSLVRLWPTVLLFDYRIMEGK